MNARCLALPAILGAALTTVSAEPSNKPDDGGVQQWSDHTGKSIDAHFVGFSDHVVTVSDKQGDRKIPLQKLSPNSQSQARNLSKVIGVYQTVRRGRFTMGSPDDEPGRGDGEVQRIVQTSEFLMKATEVTWTEWNTVRKFANLYGYTDIGAGNNGNRGFDADLHPVVGVTWWDVVKWCNLKSELETRNPVYHTDSARKNVFKIGTSEIHAEWDANGYRLPTEAEWEFACRTRDSKWQFHTGSIREPGLQPLDRNLDKAGWYAGNSDGGPNPVALKEANTFGLYDMHGNAAEWCWDIPTVWNQAKVFNPRGPIRGDQRSIRGGSWADPASACRAAARAGLTPGATPDRKVGFRIVRKPGP
jgi:formylglycine-generating enzyme required for sulfatase activity